jgi:flavin-dependent dehydrogenase
VLVLDRRGWITDRAGGPVGEGLPPAARPLLQRLGILDRIEADGHLESPGTSSAWGAPRLLDVDFVRGPDGPGWQLDRARFDATLRRLCEGAGAAVWRGARLATSRPHERGGWRLEIEVGGERRRVTAASVLDASGRAGVFARARGAVRLHHDRLVGFATTLIAAPSTDDEDSRTVVEAAPDGWWYTSRLPGRRRIVVYLTDAGSPSSRQARAAAGFDRLLARTVHVRRRVLSAGYLAAGPPRAFPANSSRLDRVVGDGWLAAGDAALAFDPLSSLGIFAALHGGLAAAQAVLALRAGDRAAVERYAEQLDRSYVAYRRNLDRYYRMETRWPAAEFWAVRHRCRELARARRPVSREASR